MRSCFMVRWHGQHGRDVKSPNVLIEIQFYTVEWQTNFMGLIDSKRQVKNILINIIDKYKYIYYMLLAYYWIN